MDSLDKDILKDLQHNFPLCPRPFKLLGEKFDVTEGEILERVEKLKDKGIIKRIGASFDSRSLGYESTLIAMIVPDALVEETASLINEYPGVTHNYLRRHKYNLWFTLIAPSKSELERTVEEIKLRTGITEFLNLPVKSFFKLNVQFNLR